MFAWRDAAGVPLLVMICVTLILLLQAGSKRSADKVALVGTARYFLAGLAAAGLIASALLGFRAFG
jgi:hypothetical protein